MTPATIVNARCGAALWAQITRANGTVGRKRLIAYYHPNPYRRSAVRLLMKLGVL